MPHSMASSDRPFEELEKRALLAEIWKNSSIPLNVLLQIITENRVDPSWPDIVLPSGRTLRQCQNVLGEMQSTYYSSGPAPPPRPPSHPHGPHQASSQPPQHVYAGGGMQGYHGSTTSYPPPSQQQQQMGYAGSPVSGEAPAPTSTGGARQIQPRPPQSLPALAPGPSRAPYPSFTPIPGVNTMVDISRKRGRGRPKKADVEAERRAAEARGETYPAPRGPKRSRTLEGYSTATGSPTSASGSVPSPQQQTTPAASIPSTRASQYSDVASSAAASRPPPPTSTPAATGQMSPNRPSSRQQQSERGSMTASPMDISSAGPTSPESATRDFRRLPQSSAGQSTPPGFAQPQRRSPPPTSAAGRSAGSGAPMETFRSSESEQQQQRRAASSRDPFGIMPPIQPFGGSGSSGSGSGYGRGGPQARSIVERPPSPLQAFHPRQQHQQQPPISTTNPASYALTRTSSTSSAPYTSPLYAQSRRSRSRERERERSSPSQSQTTRPEDVMDQH